MSKFSVMSYSFVFKSTVVEADDYDGAVEKIVSGEVDPGEVVESQFGPISRWVITEIEESETEGDDD